jgi:hypothetical protein
MPNLTPHSCRLDACVSQPGGLPPGEGMSFRATLRWSRALLARPVVLPPLGKGLRVESCADGWEHAVAR